MKKSRLLGAVAAAALAASTLTAFTAVNVAAEDTVYHAYIGVQSASYTFRNAWNEGQYGKDIVADDGTVWFDQLTGWDGNTPLNKGGVFTDAEITGDGIYSVSVTDFDFGDDETFNLLFASTDIPLDAGVTISDVKVILDGQSKYTFDEAYLSPDETAYVQPMCINIWNDDLGKEDGLFGYMMPTDSIELQFTVSGMGGEAAPAEETEAAAEEEAAAAADGVFDPNGEYNAYIGVQSASFTFRNAWNEGQYGKGITGDNGMVWFDQLTGWDGNTPLNKGGVFTDAVIKGNGTYSVSVTDFDFGADETLNLLFMSTDIPLNEEVKFTDVKVIIDGQSKYTFDEAYLSPDEMSYFQPMCINIWNDDLGKEEGLFGYMMPTESIELQFTVSGFAYDNPDAAVEETTAAETETETEAAEETSAAETEAAAEDTTAAEETTAAAEAASAEASESSVPVLPIVIAVVVVVAVVAAVVIKKNA